MSRDQIDHALERRTSERDRITTTLVELEAHPGYRLLRDARLAGVTELRRDELTSRLTLLWRLSEAHGRVLDEARALRARHPKPGQVQLTELTRLLTGSSVELPAAEVPLEARTLLGSAGETLSLETAVARMSALYEEAAGAIAAIDGVWTVLLDRLAAAEDTMRAAETSLAALGTGDAGLDDLAHRLADLRATVRTDPLSLAPDGRPDTAGIDRVDEELAALRDRLQDAVRVRDGLDERVRGIQAAIARVRATEEEAVRARDTVLAKIASPSLPDLPRTSVALMDRLAALGTLRGEGRWLNLAARTADVERAAAAALEQARATVALINGVLDRREELRGRLDAYRAKAGRLGHAEDDRLTRLYQEAHDLLWTSPCDLRQATAALARFQRAIGSNAEGASS